MRWLANASSGEGSQWILNASDRSCPLCGSDSHKVISTRMKHGLDLPTVICRKCSLVYTNPLPTEDVYSRFYREAYSKYYDDITVKLDHQKRQTEPRKVQRRRELVEKIYPLRGSRLLEVGAGAGWFLYWARRHGSDVLAVEPSPEFQQLLEEENLPFVAGGLEDVNTEQLASFDIIVMLHVFEHFYDPNRALSLCRDLLNENGVLVIEVPNILKPCRSLDRYFLRYVHPISYSPQTLQAMLHKNGFDTVFLDEWGSDWRYPQHLFIMARKTSSPTNKLQLPDQCAAEVESVLQRYRRDWLTWKAARWHSWRLSKNEKLEGKPMHYVKRLLSRLRF